MKIPYLLCVSLLAVLFFGAPAIATPGPTEVLKPTLQGMIDVIRDPANAGPGHRESRRKTVMAIAASGFDFAQMSKLVLGRTWRTIDEQQKDTFETLFTKLLENAYIGKLEAYSGQKTVYKDERIKGKKAVVSTILESPGAPSLPVNYVMLKVGAGWQVYDINIEGVSLLRNYREQFKSILRRDKFEGLVKVLEEKNASFSKKDSK